MLVITVDMYIPNVTSRVHAVLYMIFALQIIGALCIIDSKLESAISSCIQAAEAKTPLYEGISTADTCAL